MISSFVIAGAIAKYLNLRLERKRIKLQEQRKSLEEIPQAEPAYARTN